MLTSSDITLAIVQKMGPILEYDCLGWDLTGTAAEDETGAAAGGVFGGGVAEFGWVFGAVRGTAEQGAGGDDLSDGSRGAGCVGDDWGVDFLCAEI